MLNDIIATIVAIAMSIGGTFAGLGNVFTPRPATPAASAAQSQQPGPELGDADPFHADRAASAAGAVLGESTSTPARSPATIVNNYITQPVVEHAVPFPFSPATLTDLANLEAKIDARFSALANPPAFPQQVAGGGVPGSYGSPPPAAYRIDQLDGVTIRNPTIVGGSINGTSGVGGGGIGDNASTTTFFSTVGHFTTGIIDALTSTAATITNLGTTELVAVNATTTNATTTNLYVSGTATIGSGTGVLQSTSGVVSSIANGANGQVLKIAGGVPTWGTDNSGSGGGSSAWATTTDSLAVYPATISTVVLIGNSATTTTGNILEVAGNSLFRGTATAYKAITAPSFSATSTTASQLPYASTTAITATTASTTNLIVSGTSGGLLKTSATGAVALATAGVDYLSSTSGDWTGTLVGFSAAQLLAAGFSTTSADAWKNMQSFFATSSTDYWKTQNDFFATTSADAWKLTRSFFATTSSDYWFTQKTTDNLPQGSTNKYYATSLFASDLAGTTTDALAQGTTNKYWSNTLFDTRLAATTSLPNIITLANLSLPATQLTNFGKSYRRFLVTA